MASLAVRQMTEMFQQKQTGSISSRAPKYRRQQVRMLRFKTCLKLHLLWKDVVEASKF